MGNIKVTFKEYTASIDTTGIAGSATGSATITGVSGLVDSIAVNYNGSAPATTTVTISQDFGGVTENIVAVPAGNTDLITRPRVVVQDTAAADIAQRDYFALYAQSVDIAIAASDALTAAVVVTIRVIEH